MIARHTSWPGRNPLLPLHRDGPTDRLHADDLGMNRAVSDGIFQGFEQGLLTSTSLLSNAPDAARALELLATNWSRGERRALWHRWPRDCGCKTRIGLRPGHPSQPDAGAAPDRLTLSGRVAGRQRPFSGDFRPLPPPALRWRIGRRGHRRGVNLPNAIHDRSRPSTHASQRAPVHRNVARREPRRWTPCWKGPASGSSAWPGSPHGGDRSSGRASVRANGCSVG